MYSFSEIYNYSQDLNVLYVEDDLTMLHSSYDIFQSYFHHVDTAIDGEDGFQKYKLYEENNFKFYDLVITDIQMPKMNGIEMIQNMKKMHQKQTVIVISAYNDSDKLMALIQEGIPYFLTKPMVMSQLSQVLYNASQSLYNERMQNEFILNQSKMASMGEMIDTIAHQWLGPINLMKMQTEVLEMDIEDGILNAQSVLECSSKQALQIDYLVETLNEFRNFFRPSDKYVLCGYKDILNSTLILLKDKLILHTIVVEINIEQDIQLNIIPNEFKHVLINIINNAIYEFEDRKVQNPKLIINGYEEEESVVLEIIDNAGGIPSEIIEKIFQKNFTTKQDKGTGVGLHLVMLILEKINAKIVVENLGNGAKFSIRLNKI